MADPSGPFVLAVPLFLAFVAAFAWILWSRPAKPPRFRGYAVRLDWQVDPMARLDRDLRRGRLTGGIVAVRDRLLVELTEHRGLTPRDVRRLGGSAGARRTSPVERACQELRALEATYWIAYRAEDPLRRDVWSRWRRPVWRKRARREFAAELSEIESLWSLLETAS
jgi:hypothetical protein